MGHEEKTTRFVSEKWRLVLRKRLRPASLKNQGSGPFFHCGWIAELVDAVSLFEF